MSIKSREGGATGDPARLKRRLAYAERTNRLRAFGLVLPLLLFLLFTFLVPIGSMLWRAVEDWEVADAFPATVQELTRWDGHDLPDEATFAALKQDLVDARESGKLGNAAKRLNNVSSGFRSVLSSTGRQLTKLSGLAKLSESESAKSALIDINDAWGETTTWDAIRAASGPVTSFYLLKSLDFQAAPDGSIVSVPENEAIYRNVFFRTFAISAAVTALCLGLGFPVAYLLASLPPRHSNLLMIFVLLPFWTSLLVRTCAWIVLLQTEGPINELLQWTGVIQEPMRLVYNRFGVLVAMTHVLLPFMILPLYSSMKSISPVYVRAAHSLGASPTRAFYRIYLPQAIPGIGAGSLLVFILAIGYYITPALVGGAEDQMISYFIAFFTTETVNWGLASALGAMLLVATFLLAGVYSRLVYGVQVTGGTKN